MRAALVAVAVAALLAAGSADANNYAGTVAKGGSVSVAGTLLKCRVVEGILGCVVFKNGKPDPATWAFTIGDKEVQVGKVSDKTVSYTSPREPKAGGPVLQGGRKTLVVKTNENFGAAGTHVACSVLSFGGKTAIACVIVTPKGTAVPGSYGAVLTSHRIQVRTAQGAKSKVLFDRSF